MLNEGCYKLVEAKKLITSPSQNVKHVPADETSDRDEITIPLLTAGISLFGVALVVIFVLYAIRRRKKRSRDKKREEHAKKISTDSCPRGYFGNKCTEKCNDTCAGCKKVNGVCDSGCIPGWRGYHCNEGSVHNI